MIVKDGRDIEEGNGRSRDEEENDEFAAFGLGPNRIERPEEEEELKKESGNQQILPKST